MKLCNRQLAIGFLLVMAAASPGQDRAYTREKEWEREIAALLEIDIKQTPPANPVLFVGSSSIRLWTTLRRDFPFLNVMNRGFGGSRLEDLVFFAERIVVPYKPGKIVVYSGENDIEAGQAAEDVLSDFREFLAIRDRRLPGTPVIYISMKPSVLRWKLWPEMKRANELIRAETAKHKNVTFVDIGPKMLRSDGTPNPNFFVDDGLHLNETGYQLWRKVLTPYLK